MPTHVVAHAKNDVTADAARSACSRYTELPDIHGYCLFKFAPAIGDADEARAMCAEAGTWASQCRHAWVSARQRPDSGVPTELLLAMCAGNEDCNFELIDFRPSSDVYTQVARCEELTEDYEGDCVSHAVQRWYFEEQTAESLAELIERVGVKHPAKISHWVAAIIGCQGIGDCGVDPDFGPICRHKSKRFQEMPEACPARGLKKMNLGVPRPGGGIHQPGGKNHQPGGKNHQPGANSPQPPELSPGEAPAQRAKRGW